MSNADFRGLVNGVRMFGAYGPLKEAAQEALRYAHQYAEEGEVVTQMKIGGRWKTVNILASKENKR